MFESLINLGGADYYKNSIFFLQNKMINRCFEFHIFNTMFKYLGATAKFQT